MKVLILVILLFSVSICHPFGKAGSFETKQYLDEWVDMWNSYDLNSVKKLFLKNDQLTYFSSEKEGVIKGFDAVLSHHRAFGFIPGGKKQPNKLWVEDIHTTKFDKMAIITAIWFFKKPDGKIQKGPMTAVYAQSGGKYKIVHMNFSNYLPKKTNRSPLPLPDGVEAISLTGKLLYSSTPYENTKIQYEIHKKIYEKNSDIPENIIWFGRWTAYKGDFREAIGIFTEGIKKFPMDPRFYRHRGHRYITIRMFDAAIKDFEKAADLIEGTKDQIEPDGQPNDRNIPVSTLHTNIYYHLGLAHYLKNNLNKALDAYRKGVSASANDDMLVATTHWLYMTLRRLGRDREAEESLKSIAKNMDVIENMSYHQLCLFYKGKISEESLTGKEFSHIMNDAVAYGIANWYLYNNKPLESKKQFEKLLLGKVWGSFGYIAAEADYHRLFRK